MQNHFAKVYGKAQWTVEFRVEYLQDCLQITPSSSMGSNAVFLLNPKIKTEDGEWEAWYFDDKLAGAERFPSFSELMSNHYQRYFLDLLDE